MNLEVKKFYIRHKENYPESEVQDYAQRGFQLFGCETAPFYGFGDIQKIEDLGPEVGLAGYVGDIKEALSKIGKPHPENVDYPDELKEFLGRDISISTLEEIRNHPGKEVFIKPIEQKLFTGFVWSGDDISRRRICTLGNEVKVFTCESLNIISEYRCFILDFEILDCRRYKGDWHVAPSLGTVYYALDFLRGVKKFPRAFCLDWGILKSGETILIEMNEGYAFGHYGMAPDLVARMLSARWNEMSK
jgi:hypothetical protein